MSSFVRFIFMLVGAASTIGLSVIVIGNFSGKQNLDRALAAERDRIVARYSMPPEDLSLPAAHIAVESQTVSGSSVLSTTILVRQYRFNSKRTLEPSETRAASLIDDYKQRNILPIKRIVIPGRTLQVTGLYVHFKQAIPNYEFLAGKSVWCLSEIIPGPDGKTSEKLCNPPKVPDIFLDKENQQPSLMEGNLWYFVGEAIEGQQKNDAAVIERLSKFDVRMPRSKQIALNQRATYRVDFLADDITIAPEPQASLHEWIIEEAKAADKAEKNDNRP